MERCTAWACCTTNPQQNEAMEFASKPGRLARSGRVFRRHFVRGHAPLVRDSVLADSLIPA